MTRPAVELCPGCGADPDDDLDAHKAGCAFGEGCPVGDPDCLSDDDESHDACQGAWDMRSGAEVYADALAVCRRKRSYLSETVAVNAAWLWNLVPGRRAAVEPYRCPHCRDWHLRSRRS